jgi:hypothetical protein
MTTWNGSNRFHCTMKLTDSGPFYVGTYSVYPALSGWGFEHPRRTYATREEVGRKIREDFSVERTYH